MKTSQNISAQPATPEGSNTQDGAQSQDGNPSSRSPIPTSADMATDSNDDEEVASPPRARMTDEEFATYLRERAAHVAAQEDHPTEFPLSAKRSTIRRSPPASLATAVQHHDSNEVGAFAQLAEKVLAQPACHRLHVLVTLAKWHADAEKRQRYVDMAEEELWTVEMPLTTRAERGENVEELREVVQMLGKEWIRAKAFK